jgi:hypothetical protein
MCGMVRTKSHKLERQPSGYSFGEAEKALAAVFGIDAKHRRLLVARLKNLMRLGLPGTAPGKGARARYSPAQLNQWLLAMLLADTGIDPTVVVQAIKASWKTHLEPVTIRATEMGATSGNPVWIALRPELTVGVWKGETGLSIQMFQLSSRSNEFERLNELGQVVARGADKWICLLNFTPFAYRLKNALPPRS